MNVQQVLALPMRFAQILQDPIFAPVLQDIQETVFQAVKVNNFLLN